MRMQIVVDAVDPVRVAGFWRDALGWTTDKPPGESGVEDLTAASAVDPDGRILRIRHFGGRLQNRAAVDASSIGSHIFMWEHGSVGDDLYAPSGRAAVALGFASLGARARRG